MTIRTQLKRLENLAQRAASEKNRPGDRTDEGGWLARFEAWGRLGYFDRESDFGVALAFYRDALRRANVRGDFDHPEDFMPGIRNRLPLRIWRHKSCLPEDVREGWQWLAGMALRRRRDIPPVTEAEFRELTDWLEANAERLDALLPPLQRLAIGKGYQTSIFNLRLMLRKGPRTTDAGELAEAVRWLRQRSADLANAGE
jgi:hypothetical protein